MKASPCYNPKTKIDCPLRSAGCSVNCSQWADWVEYRETIYIERRQQAKKREEEHKAENAKRKRIDRRKK